MKTTALFFVVGAMALIGVGAQVMTVQGKARPSMTVDLVPYSQALAASHGNGRLFQRQYDCLLADELVCRALPIKEVR